MEILVINELKRPASFYRDAIALLRDKGCDFMIGGGFALSFHTGIQRDTYPK